MILPVRIWSVLIVAHRPPNNRSEIVVPIHVDHCIILEELPRLSLILFASIVDQTFEKCADFLCFLDHACPYSIHWEWSEVSCARSVGLRLQAIMSRFQTPLGILRQVLWARIVNILGTPACESMLAYVTRSCHVNPKGLLRQRMWKAFSFRSCHVYRVKPRCCKKGYWTHMLGTPSSWCSATAWCCPTLS